MLAAPRTLGNQELYCPGVRVRRALVPALAVLLAAATAAACDGGSGPVDPEGASARLEQAVEELVAMPSGPPGAIVVVQVGEERTVVARGVAEVGTDIVPAVDQHMRMASVAKAFTAATALALVDDGLLSLDDTIGQRLPDLPEAWAGVTLRQLLDHSSGLPDYTATDTFRDDALTEPDSPAPDPRGLVGIVEDDPLVFPSGAQYAYSNTDTVVVGLMVEAVTGRPFAEVLQSEVLDPLDLDQTSLPTDDALPEPFIHGYAGAPGEPLEDVTFGFSAGWTWTSGGVVSTPADVNAFIRGYVSGELFGDSLREQQQATFIPGASSEPSGPGRNASGPGLYRYDTACGRLYGHTGNIFGFTQLAAASSDGERSVTTTINLQRTQHSEGPDGEVFQALLDVQEAAACLAFNDD